MVIYNTYCIANLLSHLSKAESSIVDDTCHAKPKEILPQYKYYLLMINAGFFDLIIVESLWPLVTSAR